MQTPAKPVANIPYCLSSLPHTKPMKNLVYIALFAIPFLASGQKSPSGTALKPLPDYTYITPDMTRKQIDSLIAALAPYDLSLSFDTLEYDENNKYIKKIDGALYAKDEYFLVSSENFKGMTLIKRGTSVAVVMGLYYPPNKK